MRETMTNRQKFIASCSNPYYENFATREEVKEAKQLARGKYWNDDEMYQYVAFSPGGKRYFFDYDDYDNSKSISKKSALLWTKAQCAKAIASYKW